MGRAIWIKLDDAPSFSKSPLATKSLSPGRLRPHPGPAGRASPWQERGWSRSGWRGKPSFDGAGAFAGSSLCLERLHPVQHLEEDGVLPGGHALFDGLTGELQCNDAGGLQRSAIIIGPGQQSVLLLPIAFLPVMEGR